MFIEKELYRKFIQEKFLMFSAETAGAAEASEATEASTEKPEEKEKDIEHKSALISAKQKETEALIDRMVQQANAGSESDAATKLGGRLKARATTEFAKIAQEYNDAREKAGSTFGNTPETKTERANIEQKAKTHYELVANRIGNRESAKKYSVHQAWQDAIEKGADKSESVEGTRKQELVQKLLRTKGIKNPKMQEMLAKLVIESNAVTLEGPDVDAYKNLEQWFSDVDTYRKSADSALEGSVRKVVEEFVKQAPEVTAKPEEIAVIKTMILEDEGLTSRFGTESDHLEAAAEAIAKKYDIKINENGDVICAFDLTKSNNPASMLLDAEGFKNEVTRELNSDFFKNEDRIEDFSEQVDDKTEAIQIAREEMLNGVTLRDWGDKITEWKEWNGHQAAEYLLTLSQTINHYNSGLEEIDQMTQAQEKRAEKKIENKEVEKQKEEAEANKREELKQNYDKNIETADLNNAINKATGNGYKVTSPDSSMYPNFTDTFEGFTTLRNEQSGDTITVKLNSQGEMTVRIDHDKANEKTYGVEEVMTPEDFKAKSLLERVDAAKNNIDKNQKKVNEVNAQLNNLPEGMAVDFKKAPTFSELAHSNFNVPNAPITFNNITVGGITFDTTTDPTKATVRMGHNTETIPLSQLNQNLNSKAEAAKQASEEAVKTKEEIEAQKKQAEAEIKAPEGMTYKPNENFETSVFIHPTMDARVNIGTIVQNDKDVATLSVKLNKEEGQETRQYILTVNDVNHEFNTTAEINTFLESEEFKAPSADQAKAQEAMEEIKSKAAAEGVKGAEGPEGLEEMGIGELIGSLGQLYKMFQEAMKTGDWQSLQDGLKDFNEGRNPAQRIKDAKDAYETALEEVSSVSDLMALYNQPYKSPLAKQLFDKPGAKVPYRIQLKTSIKERLANELGLDISSMEAKSADRTYIEGMKGSKKLRIYLEKNDKQANVRTEEITVDKDGKESVSDRTDSQVINSLEDLNLALGGEPKMETKKPNEGENPEAKKLFKEGDNHFDAGRYAEALAAFKKANEIKPHPASELRIAKTNEKLAEAEKDPKKQEAYKEAALTAYKKYLESNYANEPEQKEKTDEAKTRITELEKKQ